ncbi:hypothetical protein BDW75DRAFT_108068 [Aspergillus navahoensis]
MAQVLYSLVSRACAAPQSSLFLIGRGSSPREPPISPQNSRDSETAVLTAFPLTVAAHYCVTFCSLAIPCLYGTLR